MLDSLQLQRIAHLARIEVTPDELGALGEKLGGVMQMIETMRAVNVDAVEPMAHVQAAGQPLREDAVTEVDRTAAFQPLAPAAEDHLYLVPKVIE